MSLLNHETGELIQLDRAAAERRAERITLRLESIADNTEAVKGMIREAITKRDDIALGYRSLGEYVSDRFGGSMARLGVEVRRAFVVELTEAGMSTRAIAPVVGVHFDTVARDVARVVSTTPETPAATTIPLEGVMAAGALPHPSRTAVGETPKVAPDEEIDTAAAAVVTDDSTATTPEAGTPAPARPPVVGIDGKTYTRPTSIAKTKPEPRRRPLPDQFFTAAFDLTKVVERIDRLVTDDRFPQNADKVAAKHRYDLVRAVELLSKALDRLP